MVRWHHRLDGLEFEQALGIGEGQGSLTCCNPQGLKESDTALQLNNNNNNDRLEKLTHKMNHHSDHLTNSTNFIHGEPGGL